MITKSKLNDYLLSDYKHKKSSTLNKVWSDGAQVYVTDLELWTILEKSAPKGSVTYDEYRLGYEFCENEESGFCPTIDRKSIVSSLIVSDSVTKKMKKALECSDKNDSRFAFNGVFFSLNIVGTDGRQLFASENIDYIGEIPKKIVPFRTVKKALRMDLRFVYFTDEFVFFEGKMQGDTVTIASRYIDANFPDYQSVIPKNYEKHFALGHDFSGFLNSALKLGEKPSRSIKLGADFLSFELESTKEVHKTETKNELDCELRLKGEYCKLLDLKKPIAYIDSKSPLLQIQENGIYVVMPMKL